RVVPEELAAALADLLRLLFEGFDLRLGDLPRAQGIAHRFQAGDVEFDLLPLVADGLLGDTALAQQDFEVLQALLVEAQLRDGVDELALLLAEVLAPEHGEQLALFDPVAVVERPFLGLFLGAGVYLGGLADLLDLAGEKRVNAREVIRVEAE